jgi:hypothetical protein
MSDHDHKQVVPGCYRCDLGRDEERESMLAEIDTLRADLREAMELLRAHWHPPTWLSLGEAADWNTRYGKLLKKHEETNQ